MTWRRDARNWRRGLPRPCDERGLALMGVLAVVLVMAILGALVLHLSGKEVAFSALRLLGNQGIYLAEGGAYAARAALMAFMNADPIGVTTVHPSVDGMLLASWFAGGDASAQNPFALFDYLVTDGQRFTLNASPSTTSVTFHVNWALATPHRKLQVPSGSPPANPLGNGTYQATVVVTKRRVPHSSCTGAGDCYIHRLGSDEYEFFFTYDITSDAFVPPHARRRVTLSRNYSIRVRRQNFAQYALFTHIHTSPTGQALWFADMTRYDGPVHTNGEFRFAYFPKFGTPDPNTPCDPARIRATRLTSASNWAWYFNRGSPRRLQANENVVGGIRRDAPVLPDCTPGTLADDADNPPANFTRGVAVVPYPTNPYSQKGAAIGRDPGNTNPVTDAEITAVIPELQGEDDVPNGIYVPVTDTDGDGCSDPGEPLAGGIYVEGDLTSLVIATGGPTGNLAVYTFTQGGRTVTVTVDRVAGTTTVSDTAWRTPPQCGGLPATRTFAGVPKGWRPFTNNHATIVYVEGDILSLAGTLEEKEQTTIVASGRVVITDHLRYEDPPVVTDPYDNPINLLGIYSPRRDIVIGAAAPDDLVIHAVLMAGNLSDGYNSSIFVQDYQLGAPRGTVYQIGGRIQEYAGVFGVMNRAGTLLSGYGSDIRFDRRMARGFSPPYFPTTTNFEVAPGTDGLAGVRPIWREATP